jgi:N-acetylglutamate synthase-like GNAT family acetyltransferase
VAIIREITEPELKRAYVRAILESLPAWFGIPEAVEQYVEESGNLPFYAAVSDGDVVGFCALKQHNPFSAEVYAMGVSEQCHRHGIGRQLIQACLDHCRRDRIEFLQVKTLDAANPDPNYAKTRAFYSKMGFKPLECLPNLWDASNPCLIMIQHIAV